MKIKMQKLEEKRGKLKGGFSLLTPEQLHKIKGGVKEANAANNCQCCGNNCNCNDCGCGTSTLQP